MTLRPSARALARKPAGSKRVLPVMVDSRELAILRAKADVCDAYRHWLITTTRKDRCTVSAALGKLRRLETLLLEARP